MKEKELVDHYLKLRHREANNCIILKERGFRQKKIDVIELDFKSRYFLHGIEFKVSNWRIGLEQCLGNRLLVPYNSLALYYKFEKNVNIEEFMKYGIGLIIISEYDYVQRIQPQKNDLLDINKTHRICENIKNLYPEILKNYITPYS